ncbi:MAG: helix-turn-helix transcriptional regulator [Phycisphaerales bacterium]|nr:helix-turn-helix transcriptional regulator [Phycisphaerales bacterium]
MKAKGKPIDLGDQLRRAIADSGLSRFEVARRASISYSQIHSFCAGKRSLTLDTASRVAAVVGLHFARVKR